MRKGKYFQIPEGPADIERLWREGCSLDTSHLPSWLSAETATGYRIAAADVITALPTPNNGNGYHGELEELESNGLIVDGNGNGEKHVYVPTPAYPEIWSIGIYKGVSPLRLQPSSDVPNPVMTRDHVTDVQAVFVADPFMIRVNQQWHMFFEVMNWRANKGEIGLATSEDGINWSYQQIVLAEPFHLSYPHVFEWDGEYYMIPESFQAGGIRLYKARRFPGEWELVAELLSGSYFVDSSVFNHGGKWWLFTEASKDARHETLRLYYADVLTGPWTEHPMSPVVKGNGMRARPAGRISMIDNMIVRYAQGCYPAYGSSVRAFAVTELTTSAYADHEAYCGPILKATGSGWNALGMHHVDAHRLADGNWLACVDGWRGL